MFWIIFMHFFSNNFKDIFVKRIIPVKTAAFVDTLVEVTFVNVQRDGKETAVVVRTQNMMCLRYLMYSETLLNNLNHYRLVQYVLLFKHEMSMNQIHMTDTI